MNKLRIKPAIRDTQVTYPIILKLFNLLGFTLKSTNIPIPELANKPAHTAGKLNKLSRYNCVNKTLEAQLGINPVKVHKKMEALGY